MSASGGRRPAMAEAAEREEVTLEELKTMMAEFARERDWDQFHSPRNLLLAMVMYTHVLFSNYTFLRICFVG